MYRIVAGDDDTGFLTEVIEKAERSMTEIGLVRGRDFEITGFDSPALLRDALLSDSDICQFLLLDVEFAEQNGMELAKILRDRGLDFTLVYLTSYRDYVFDCFGTKPLWYLVKPADWEKLAGLLREDYRERCQKESLCLKINGRTLNLPYSEIFALEAAAHHVRIWLSGRNPLEWNGPLSRLEQEISVPYFCKCHSSFLINLTHVSEVLRNGVCMDDGRVFPVSRRFYNFLLQQYFSVLKR